MSRAQRFTLDIKLGNAAFDGDPCPELARLLREVASEVASHRLSGLLFDVNGNNVGGFDTELDDDDDDGDDDEDRCPSSPDGVHDFPRNIEESERCLCTYCGADGDG